MSSTDSNKRAEKLLADKTVNLDSSMTNGQIQALIDAQPKNLNGFILFFQFADGTYTIDTALLFQNFYGGTLTVQGNSSESTTKHTDQAVHLDGSTLAATGSCLLFDNCSGKINVKWIKASIPDDTGCKGIFFNICDYGDVSYCYVVGAAKTTGNYGILWNQANGYCDENYVSNVYFGFAAQTCIVRCDSNSSTGTLPNYGQYSNLGATIHRFGSTQPAGAISPVYVSGVPNVGSFTGLTSYTVNFDPSMSTATMQQIIYSQPRNLEGVAITFQFADGTYTCNDTILFSYFVGGTIQVYGNSADGNTKTTTHAVHLNGAGLAASEYCLQFYNCSCAIYVRWFKMTVSDNAATSGVFFQQCTGVQSVEYCYCVGSAKTGGNHGFNWYYCNAGYINECYVSNVSNGIFANGANVRSHSNSSTGTGPNYGLNAAQASIIVKSTATQPTGTTANELGSYIK